MIRRLLHWFQRRPAPVLRLQTRDPGRHIFARFEQSLLRDIASQMGVSYEQLSRDFAPTPLAPPQLTYVPMSDAEREENGRAHSAARAAAIAEQVHINEFQDPPEVCAARAADPAWQEEQRVKREVSSEAWVAYRNEVGMPVVAKAAGERF